MDRNVARLRNALKLDGKLKTPDSTQVTVLFEDSRGVFLAYGATVPTDAETGYATGCIFIDTNGAAGAVMYANEGDATSCDFNTSLVSGDISSVVAGAGMTGGGVSGAVTLNVIGDEVTITVAADEVKVKDGGIGATQLASGAVTPIKLGASEALTATDDGTTTGAMSGNASHAVVTSSAATKQVSLPASSAGLVGKQFTIWVGANGFELITPAASNATINTTDSDGTNQADIAANTLSRLTLVTTGTWILESLTALGAVATAIVPDND